MGSLTGEVSGEVRGECSEKEQFEILFDSCTGWVTDARAKLQTMDERKIELFNPILDKLSRGMYGATKNLYGSAKESSPNPSGYNMEDALEIAARTFYFNRYSDLDYIGDDLKSEKIAGLKGADILADAFESFKSLKGIERQEIQNLADRILTGIYEATKEVYSSDRCNDDAYRNALDNIANIFGSAMIKEGE